MKITITPEGNKPVDFDLPDGGLITIQSMVEENSLDIKSFYTEQPSDNMECESLILELSDD